MLPQTLLRALRPLAKKLLDTAVQPTLGTRWFFRGAFAADTAGRELYEWGRRALWATPLLLSRCESHGARILIDRLPYVTGTVRLRLADDVRISGKIDILSPSSDEPGLLEIGEGVFIGHGCQFAVARHVKLGKFVSIGAGSSIADTEGHAAYDPQRPIWEVPAGAGDVAPVILEDGVQLGKSVTILKGVTVGARSVVGAGAVLRSSVPPDSVVVGNPARVVQRRERAPLSRRRPAGDGGGDGS